MGFPQEKKFIFFVPSGILKVPPPSQMLFNKDSQLMEDEKTLAEYGLTSATAKAQCPAPIGLALRYIFACIYWGLPFLQTI